MKSSTWDPPDCGDGKLINQVIRKRNHETPDGVLVRSTMCDPQLRKVVDDGSKYRESALSELVLVV